MRTVFAEEEPTPVEETDLRQADRLQPLAQEEQRAITEDLLDLADRIQEWREEWEDAYAAIKHLAEGYAGLADELGSLRGRTQRLAAAYVAIRKARGLVGTDEKELARKLWKEVGGRNPDLRTLQTTNPTTYANWKRLILMFSKLAD